MQWQEVFGHSSREALFCVAAGGRPVSLAEFTADLSWACARLRSMPSLEARSAVALFCTDTYEFCVWFFAALACDLDLVIPANNKRETSRALTDVVLWLGEWPGAGSAALRLEPACADTASPVPKSFNGNLQLFTSGSSGEPQRIGKTLPQLVEEISAQEQHWGATAKDACVLATVSHQHIYGLLFKVLWPVFSGRPFVARTYVDVAALLRDVEPFAPAIWVASPAQLSRRNESWPWEQAQKLAAIFSSGGPLATEDAAAIAGLTGRWPTEIYGSTETGGIAWRQQNDGNRWWTPLRGVTVGVDSDGLLQIKSPWIPDGFSSQDRVRQQGVQFELLGRADQIAKIEEKRISLSLVERLLMNNPLVSEAKVLVLPKGTERSRDLLGALVVLSESGTTQLLDTGKSTLVRQLRHWLAPDLDGVALPRSWRFVTAIPVNQQGKSPRELLMQPFESNSDVAGSDTASSNTPEAMLPQVESTQVLAMDSPAQSCAKVTLRIPHSLPCLPGHFETAPVVPGVVQIDWAVHFARSLLGVCGAFAGMENIKFKQLLVPEEQAELELIFDQEKQRLHYRFFWESEEFSSGRLSFQHA
ncbi:AMP-binding protein [Microbulbifer sp. SA54]|uniref:ApeI family dehydratase n=1 Tax=Microbulbifer sp. SA54 TaxID=3401577 RepID=UPI003AAC5914